MSRRARREAVSSLAIVLPRPELPRRHSSRSSLLSQNSVSTPRTPSGCPSPRCQSWLMTSNTSNRKSTDSWNSSNVEFGEDCDAEWKPEQTLLLSRTLDALPAHLTPFNGPIPPSNLLDKIARGVSDAKGPNEWPHSLRATRVKLIEIARQRAKDEHSTRSSRPIIDENDAIRCYTPENDVNLGFSRKTSMGIRRPLYRQSSMDFMNTDDRKPTDTDSINRLSTRLQRTENSLSSNNYHPYTRSRARALTLAQARQGQMNRRSSSPPRRENVPSLISPSTPSSSTLNTLSSLSTSAARPHLIRRSASTLTSSDISMLSSQSSMGEEPALTLLPSGVSGSLDPRMQRLKRSESFCAPSHPLNAFGSPIRKESTPSGTPPPTRQAFKRAPSYGTLAQEAREREKEKRNSGIFHLEDRDRMNASPCPSSDEEEKVRDKKAKKPRVPGLKTTKTTVPQLDPPVPETKKTRKGLPKVASCTDKSPKKKKASPSSPMIPESGTDGATTVPRSRMNLQRNPSIFGEELPHLHIPSASTSNRYQQPVAPTSQANRSPSTPTQPSGTPEVVPTDPQRKVRTLRRVKRLAPSRKISFGSLVPPAGEDLIEEENEDSGKLLESAFQLS
ncbi:hypothetical protein L218DRAFT_651520 [Marasmius fiardii PR-910]|nr:hypothetical protein L218DRAFT_651520 [Marasmius fiardii PR-910]